MAALIQKMIEDMQLHGFAERTQEAYLLAVSQLARYYRKSPDRIHSNNTAEEKAELARLRKENKQLRLEREILSHRPDAPAGKAAAWFARETEAVPPKSSNL